MESSVIVILVFTVQMLIFAGFYYLASINCQTTDQLTFTQSFGLSLIISATVGYTLPQNNSVM